MGYILPDTDQSVSDSHVPRCGQWERRRVPSARIWEWVQEAPGVFVHWTFLRRKEGKLKFQRY